jgi:hypothetical protein
VKVAAVAVVVIFSLGVSREAATLEPSRVRFVVVAGREHLERGVTATTVVEDLDEVEALRAQLGLLGPRAPVQPGAPYRGPAYCRLEWLCLISAAGWSSSPMSASTTLSRTSRTAWSKTVLPNWTDSPILMTRVSSATSWIGPSC